MYKHFGREFLALNWSEKALRDMFEHETYGLPSATEMRANGYFEGKRVLDITVAMWNQDLTAHDRGEPRVLFSWELYAEYPRWFIEKVIPKRFWIAETVNV